MKTFSPEQIEKKKHVIELKNGTSITVEEIRPGEFELIDENIISKAREKDNDFNTRL